MDVPILISVMPLPGGQGGLNLGVQLTLFKPGGGGADYAYPITACAPGFENLTAFLDSYVDIFNPERGTKICFFGTICPTNQSVTGCSNF